MQPDDRTCPRIPSQFVVASHHKDIRIVSLDVDYFADIVLPVDGMGNVSSADIDRQNGDIYWTDSAEDVIMKSTFEGKDAKVIINDRLGIVDNLVVDSIGRKVHFY